MHRADPFKLQPGLCRLLTVCRHVLPMWTCMSTCRPNIRDEAVLVVRLRSVRSSDQMYHAVVPN